MLNKVVTFCSVYLPPSDHIAKTDLINLIEQLPSPFVLLGDFNSHSPAWGNESYNSRGQMLEDLFSEMDLCILNDGSSTYIHQLYLQLISEYPLSEEKKFTDGSKTEEGVAAAAVSTKRF